MVIPSDSLTGYKANSNFCVHSSAAFHSAEEVWGFICFRIANLLWLIVIGTS